MQALRFIYIVVWVYTVYYAGYMIFELLGEKSIPLLVALTILFLIKWIINFSTLIEK